MSQRFESIYPLLLAAFLAVIPFGSARAVDTDSDGLSDQEEIALAATVPTDPGNPHLPAHDWYVSAANGSDTLSALGGGGTAEDPWLSIGMAMTALADLPRASFPIRVLLDDEVSLKGDAGQVVLYEEDITLLPWTTLEPYDDATGSIHIRPSSVGNGPAIQGAPHATLRGLVLRPAGELDQPRALLQIDSPPMTVEKVSFDGAGRSGTIGIDVSGDAPSDFLIRGCLFTSLGIGIRAADSNVELSDNWFININADGEASRCVYVESTSGEAPNFGSRTRIAHTGFNVFRGVPIGSVAIEFADQPAGKILAQYNDWGAYIKGDILARVALPVGSGPAEDAIEVEPFIPTDKSFSPGTVVGILLDQDQTPPIALSASPHVITGGVSVAVDAQGLFSFHVLSPGLHHFSGIANGYSAGAELPLMVSDDPIEALRIPLTKQVEVQIRGRVTTGGVGQSGVKLTASSGRSTTTDSNGNYALDVIAPFSGSVTPSKVGFSFTPPSRNYIAISTLQLSQDYTSVASGITISGVVTTSGTANLSGILMTATGGATASTDSGGNYTLNVASPFTGSVTPSKGGLSFDPVFRAYTNLSVSQVNQNYVTSAQTIRISGRVSGAGTSGITITASGGITDIADSDGDYQLTVPSPFTGSITPSKPGFAFTPASLTFSNVSVNQVNQNFAGTPALTISGRITNTDGNGQSGVTLSASTGQSTTTDGNGNYSLPVTAPFTGTVTPSGGGLTFTPANRSYSAVNASQSGQDYTAASGGSGGGGCNGKKDLPQEQASGDLSTILLTGALLLAGRRGYRAATLRTQG